MRNPWTPRVERAAALAGRDDTVRPLLEAYGRILGLQRDCYATLSGRGEHLAGSLDRDLPVLREGARPMLTGVAAWGPPLLAEDARQIAGGGDAAIDSTLIAGWQASSAAFFPKILLQPYAEWLAATGVCPSGRDLLHGRCACPFCGGPPQLSILQSGADADGGGRELLCATCRTAWPLRRILCPHCGEEDERRLGYFHSGAFDHLRVDACETCRHYLKTVDLTRLGRAAPLVDEVAGAALDLWAREQGYEKIELNLLGL
jgi:uncharacterized protein YbaR (Trm112 family)